jgi:hypothetical protein
MSGIGPAVSLRSGVKHTEHWQKEASMELSLAPHESEVLTRVLTSALGDLRMEISNTERYELREGLKADETVIKAILARLGVEHPFGALA